jgi:SPP1 family phage portal protein
MTKNPEETDHFFGGVPVVEYLNNDEAQGDFEQQVSLIDAYNTLQSDRVNDKEQLIDAILVIINAHLGNDEMKLLKEQRGIELPEGSDAKYLIKQLVETEVEVLKKAIADDIHKFSMVPNLTDEEFAGNLSGVAIRYKLFGFGQLIKDKEAGFESGLMERFKLYNFYLNVKNHMPIIPTTDVEAVFSRNLPVNENELAQMGATLKDTLSDESIITLLAPLLSSLDPKEEIEKLKAQRAEAVKNAQTAFGYMPNTPAPGSDNTDEGDDE